MSLFKKGPQEEDISYQERRAAKKKADKAAEKETAPKEKPRRMTIREEIRDLAGTRRERKSLKRNLRKQGVKTRSDFEIFASEVGLTYPEGSLANAQAKFMARGSVLWHTFLASISAWKILLTAAVILALVFYTSYVTEEKGQFTVNVTKDMLEQGFQISETEDFSKNLTRLYAQQLENSNATSIYEMNRNVANLDGSHNGSGYMAYTFYLRNNGTETTNYGYTVNILSETLGTASATWVMFFEDDRQIMYAKAQDNGVAENLLGYPDPPFYDSCYYPDQQYYQEDEGGTKSWGIKTTPFIDDYTALQGYVSDFEPDSVKKYTIVVWLEGDDPDCNNSILGGHVGFNITFERLGDDASGFFKGLFRTEYEKSYYNETPDETDTSHAGTGERVAKDG